MKYQPAVITADRLESAENGWQVWVRGWDGRPGESAEMDLGIFSKKKDALSWCKDRYPGVRVMYSTDDTRRSR